MAPAATGRRERKKAQTRQVLADEALRLFAKRGFDSVTVLEIADAADVSVSTLFKYFPTKEALVFGNQDEIEAGFVTAVTARPPGTPVLHALRDYLIGPADRPPAGPTPRVVALVDRTPALSVHLERLWIRNAEVLAGVLARDQVQEEPDVHARALARYIVLVPSIARVFADREQAIRDIFDKLERGWGSV